MITTTPEIRRAHQLFYSRDGDFSIKSKAAVDNYGFFQNTLFGIEGSVHDAKI